MSALPEATETTPHVAVLYHAQCMDGFGAAWAAWRHLGAHAVYLPAQYGQPVPVLPEGCQKLYILDFSYPRETLLGLADRFGADSLLVLDHHKSAQEALAGLVFVVFDQERSGAGMAWDYFHSEKRPKLINFIEDRDLWRYRFEETRAIGVWLRSFQKEFWIWDFIATHLDFDFQAAFDEAKACRRLYEQLVSETANEARWIEVDGHTVPIVNATVAFASEVCEELCKRNQFVPFAVSYSDSADGRRFYQLRSRSTFDVSEVAKKFGGGGHKAAAGFQLELGHAVEDQLSTRKSHD